MNRKKIERILQVKQSAVDSAEAANAHAHAAALQADADRAEADRRWLSALDTNAQLGAVGLMYDLDERDQHVRYLRRVVDDAERRYLAARTAEAATREALTHARVELRRFETWLERAREQEAREQGRRERVREDEVAAQKRAVNG